VSADKSGIAEKMTSNLPHSDVGKNFPYKCCPYVFNVASAGQTVLGFA